MASDALRRNAEMREAMVKRFGLWIAVGNAGGLIAVSSRMADNLDQPIAYVLLPSAWIFATGLVLAGVFTVMMMLVTGNRARPHPEATPRGKAALDLIADLGILAGIASAFLFMAGLFYPLTVLSLRYAATGSLA